MRYNRDMFVTKDDVQKLIRHLESAEVSFDNVDNQQMAEVMEAGYASLESGEPEGILGELIDQQWLPNRACLDYIESVDI